MSEVKVTEERIKQLIENADVRSDTLYGKCTIVSVKLKNGFILTESSACVDTDNYDFELGKKICMKKIEDKLWMLEGYLLQQEEYEKEKDKEYIIPLEIMPATVQKELSRRMKEILAHNDSVISSMYMATSNNLNMPVVSELNKVAKLLNKDNFASGKSLYEIHSNSESTVRLGDLKIGGKFMVDGMICTKLYNKPSDNKVKIVYDRNDKIDYFPQSFIVNVIKEKRKK